MHDWHLAHGYRYAGLHCGVRPGRDHDDLVLIVSDVPASAAGVFTQNRVRAAPVRVCQQRLPRADARGIIMYTPDGYMSAQLMRAGRTPFGRDDPHRGDDDELAAAAEGYMSYAGPFSVVDDGLIAHHVEVSLLPNWIRGIQYRTARLQDDCLELGPAEPIMIDGALVFPDVSVGYIGLERDHATALARHYYCKLPVLEGRRVFVIDPMLATGGSASQALSLVKQNGAAQPKLVCIVAAPEGLARVEKDHPDAEIHAAALDRGLNSRKYILPGLGDFGDRLFGT